MTVRVMCPLHGVPLLPTVDGFCSDQAAAAWERGTPTCREAWTRLAGRIFLTRPEATMLLGLWDAGQRAEPLGVLVACKDHVTGEVYEALPGECLHAQIALRVRRAGQVVDGWTLSGSHYAELVGRRSG